MEAPQLTCVVARGGVDRHTRRQQDFSISMDIFFQQPTNEDTHTSTFTFNLTQQVSEGIGIGIRKKAGCLVFVGLSFLFYVPCCCFCCLLVFNEVEVGANIHTNFDELHSVDEL